MLKNQGTNRSKACNRSIHFRGPTTSLDDDHSDGPLLRWWFPQPKVPTAGWLKTNQVIHTVYHSWNESISKINQQIVLGRRCCVVFGDGVPCHMFINILISIYYIDTYTAYITVYPYPPCPWPNEWVFISSTQRAMITHHKKRCFLFFILGGIFYLTTPHRSQLDKTNTGWIQLFARKMDGESFWTKEWYWKRKFHHH